VSEFLYVPNERDNTVSVIDTATDLVIATIPVEGIATDSVAVSPNGAFVYVANESGIVSVISTATNLVVGTINAGSGAAIVSFNPDRTLAYVTHKPPPVAAATCFRHQHGEQFGRCHHRGRQWFLWDRIQSFGWALDPRSFKVHSISAPDQHERGEHYLQRFWRHLPQNGQIVVFDRSWYGRVLVERVEGLATQAEWRRAYREINEFERMLTDSGVRLVKLFLHITAKEQAHRFRDRLINPLKRWKLSYEDFRNRTRRADYVVAIEDMLEETSTKFAPWYLIPANDKPFGRIAAFRVLVERFGRGVSLRPRLINPQLFKEAKRTLDLSAANVRRAAKEADRRIRSK
jgi:YVTN family beta-propeller protein